MKKIFAIIAFFAALVAGYGVYAWPIRGAAVVASSISQRTVLNMNTGGKQGPDYVYEYAFINHFQNGNYGPTNPGSYASPAWAWANGNPLWNRDILDNNGYVDVPGVSGTQLFGGHIFVPSSTDFSGPYILETTGDCEFQLLTGTWSGETVLSGSNYTRVGNGDWRGTNLKLQINYSGTKAQISWRIAQTNQLGNGYCRDLKFYRSTDAADLAAGNVFRAPWKQKIVELNPSAIRFVNWTGGNNALMMRFEQRQLPGYVAYSGGSWNASLPYPQAGSSGDNRMTVAAVSGTPASMQNGEAVMTRLSTSMVRSGSKTVSAVSKCDPASTCTCTGASTDQVTSTAHGFTTGDRVVFLVSSGMTQLNYWDSIITVCDANHFNTTINTTPFTTFTSGSVSEQVTLNVGGRGDYPIVTWTAQPIASVGSNNYLHANDYRTFYFDKSITASRDSSGAPIMGAWLTSVVNLGAPTSVNVDINVPIEVCVKLINELESMYQAQGFGGPTHAWFTVPAPAVLSMDSDYTSASSWPIGIVDIALNGANGYSGLPGRSWVMVEYSNETWNIGPNFTQASYVARRGNIVNSVATTSNYSYYSAVRSATMARDIRGYFGNNSRVKVVQAGQAAAGAVGSPNAGRINGASSGFAFFYVDPTVATFPTVTVAGGATTNGSANITVSSTANIPECSGIQGPNIPVMTTSSPVQAHVTGPTTITLQSNCGSFPSNITATGTSSGLTFSVQPNPQSYHDYFAGAPYLDLPSAYVTTTAGTGTLTDDTAMYLGLDNSSNGGGNYSGAANTNQALANATARLVSGDIATYYTLQAALGNTLNTLGQKAIQYEGGTNWPMGGTYFGVSLSANQVTFLAALQGSTQWATAFVNAVNNYSSATGVAMPSIFVEVFGRWGHVSVNATSADPDTYSGGVEGGALNAEWQQLGIRNSALP